MTKRQIQRGLSMDKHDTLLPLNQNRVRIAAILPDLSGLEALDLEQWKDSQVPQLLEELPVILFTLEDSPELRSKGLDYGAADVIPLDYEPYAMLHRIRNIVELHLYKQHLNALVEEQARQLHQSNESMVDVLFDWNLENDTILFSDTWEAISLVTQC